MDRNFHWTVNIQRPTTVALRKESVDRNNSLESKQIDPSVVALRKESVDRNSIGRASFRVSTVALRKESVDRNVNLRVLDGSKSSIVALRKESVDRN